MIDDLEQRYFKEAAFVSRANLFCINLDAWEYRKMLQ